MATDIVAARRQQLQQIVGVFQAFFPRVAGRGWWHVGRTKQQDLRGGVKTAKGSLVYAPLWPVRIYFRGPGKQGLPGETKPCEYQESPAFIKEIFIKSGFPMHSIDASNLTMKFIRRSYGIGSWLWLFKSWIGRRVCYENKRAGFGLDSTWKWIRVEH
jgi:hypothetical protein